MCPPSRSRQFALQHRRAVGRVEILREFYLKRQRARGGNVREEEVNAGVLRGNPDVELRETLFDVRPDEVFTGMDGNCTFGERSRQTESRGELG